MAHVGQASYVVVIVISVPAVTMANAATAATAHQTHTFPNFWADVLIFLPPNLYKCLAIKRVLYQAEIKNDQLDCTEITI